MVKDAVTLELPGVPKRRGRPPTGKAQSGASRMAAYRARLAAAGLETLTLDVDQEVACALRAYVDRKKADAEDLTLGQAVERILRDRLLRKR
jgi:phage-related tail fiber protein